MRFMIPGSRRYFGQPLDRRDILGFLGTLLASAAFNAPARAADPAGRVEEINGDAFADASNQHRSLERAS